MTQNLESWLYIDDNLPEASAFAERLGATGSPLSVTPISPGDARDLLAADKLNTSGILIDVDLSNAPGQQGSGPGIAQDIRIKQRAGALRDFPVVRFAAISVVARDIDGDPASDDLFDWRAMKEDVARRGVQHFWSHLSGISEVYLRLPEFASLERIDFPRMVGLTPEAWDQVGHPAFTDRVLASLQNAVHVAAGAFIRSFLLVPGLLIDEELLAVRLGVDRGQSEKAWPLLLERLDFAYTGIGARGFKRWWSRGLDEWWAKNSPDHASLSSLSIAERVSSLNKTGVKGLAPLVMPKGSAGDRPWRLCSISLEEQPPNKIPLDPTESVRLVDAVDLPVWVDPKYAAIGPARQRKRDFRLNVSDMQRLTRKYR